MATLAGTCEPACHSDAVELLRRAGFAVDRVVLVDVDAILYVSGSGRPMTAWLRRSPGWSVPEVRVQAGFCAERGVLFSDEEEQAYDGA